MQDLFQQAQLAEAAYANLWDATLNKPITATDNVKTALIAAGFSKDPNDATKSAQADDFLLHWQVLSQYTAPSNFYGLTGTGFSATLFFSKDTGQYTFAIRGTEPGYPDLFGADFGDLVVDGLPLDQIVEMYNYWQSLTHPGHYQAAKLEVQLSETAALKLLVGPLYTAAVAALQASGAIIDTTPLGTVVRRIVWDDSATLLAGTPLALGSAKISGTPTQLNVTGHSLGGNLAAAFTRLFPGVDANAITINGAGFPTGNLAGLSGNAASNIRNLFGNLNGAGAFDASRIQNVVGDGPKMVSMDSQYGLVQPGKPQLEIYIEDHLGNTVGHGAAQMTDSLAVYDLFIRLDSNLSTQTDTQALAKLKPLFEASSNIANTSLEQLVAAVDKLLGGSGSALPTDDRDALYTRLQAIEKKLTDKHYTLDILAAKSRDDLVALSKNNIAYRYALKELNPFAILGADYDPQNTAGQLNLFDPATGTGEMTKEYLADRAAFLTWKNKLATEDFDGTTGAYSKAPDAYFKDLGSNLTINLGSGGSLTDKPRYIFGADQSGGATENLTGGSKALNILSGTDRIFVKNFTDGKLGITLSGGSLIAPPSSQHTITLPLENTAVIPGYAARLGYCVERPNKNIHQYP
ncbi:MAG TPA: hypothetical protein PLI90_04970 [Rhodocyclaceae bacterium]|nr:hypothetical protein [Rhodocyclaceae bacterium]